MGNVLLFLGASSILTTGLFYKFKPSTPPTFVDTRPLRAVQAQSARIAEEGHLQTNLEAIAENKRIYDQSQRAVKARSAQRSESLHLRRNRAAIAENKRIYDQSQRAVKARSAQRSESLHLRRNRAAIAENK